MMGNGEDGQNLGKRKLLEVFCDFMTRIAKFEELAIAGSSFLVGFQQALGFIARPPIAKTSPLIEQLMKDHGTQRFLSYVEAGCMNSHDSFDNVSKLHKCHLKLQDHIIEAKSVVDALKHLIDELVLILQDDVVNNALDFSIDDDEQVCTSDYSKPQVVDYGFLMATIYSMTKQEYAMQDLIVSSLNLKSSPGELQTYCQMWSLRPYIDDDVMYMAWILVP